MRDNYFSEKNTDPIFNAVMDAIKQRIQVIADKCVEDGKKEIARRIPEIVSAVSLELMGMINVDRMGTDLRILIKLEKEKK